MLDYRDIRPTTIAEIKVDEVIDFGKHLAGRIIEATPIKGGTVSITFDDIVCGRPLTIRRRPTTAVTVIEPV